MSEVLGEHIRRVVDPRDNEQFNLFEHHYSISYKVVLDVNVFGALFSDWILCYEERTLVITTHRNRGKFVLNFFKHLFDPNSLVRTITQSHILSLSRGEGGGFLQVRIPKENSIHKCEVEARLQVTSNFVLTPVRVSTCNDAFARFTIINE